LLVFTDQFVTDARDPTISSAKVPIQKLRRV